jgi:hypothetical protein
MTSQNSRAPTPEIVTDRIANTRVATLRADVAAQRWYLIATNGVANTKAQDLPVVVRALTAVEVLESEVEEQAEEPAHEYRPAPLWGSPPAGWNR